MIRRLVIVSFVFVCSRLVAEAKDYSFPVVLPPFHTLDAKPNTNPKWGTCLFYLETLIINVFPTKKEVSPMAAGALIGTNSTANKFTFKDDYVSCIANATKTAGPNDKFTPQSFSFVLDLTIGPDGVVAKSGDKTYFKVDGNVVVKMNFVTTLGYGWTLTDVELPNGLTIKSAGDPWLTSDLKVDAGKKTNGSLAYMNFGTYGAYNYGCSKTKTVIFEPSGTTEYHVGLQFGNIQVQPVGYVTGGQDGKQVHFSHLTHDCVGTFSEGSWMGIIVALVLISVMIGGYLMLDSIQTVDRFDDPKQKQLIINAKE